MLDTLFETNIDSDHNGSETGVGFAAGTLVHTKEGLVPIEQIKVGDWVLSQPDMKAERAFKQVTNTSSYEDKEIWIVRYFHEDSATELGVRVETLGVTANHPFWVKDVGWTCVDHLENLAGHELELQDGTNIKVLCARPLYRTIGNEGVAWAESAWGGETGHQLGYKVPVKSLPLDVVGNSVGGFGTVVDDEDQFYRSDVFYIEVEDFHTYYVGDLGVWVHDANFPSEESKVKGRDVVFESANE